MMYRGYYIVNSKAEIDALIKAQNIRRMQRMNNAMLNANGAMAMAYSIEAQKAAEYLHNHCGMTWAEIEAVEFA